MIRDKNKEQINNYQPEYKTDTANFTILKSFVTNCRYPSWKAFSTVLDAQYISTDNSSKRLKFRLKVYFTKWLANYWYFDYSAIKILLRSAKTTL